VRNREKPSGIFLPLFLLFSGVIVFFIMFYFFSSITLPFLITIIFAYLMSPLVTKLEKRGIVRPLAVLILLIFILCIFFFLFRFGLPALFAEIQDLSGYLPRLQAALPSWENKLTEMVPFVNWKDVQTSFSDMLGSMIKKLVGSIPDILSNIITIIYFLVIIPFLLFFFMKDGRIIVKRIISFAPNRFFEVAAYMVREIDVILGRFLRGIFIENTIIAALAVTGLSIIGMKNAVLIGIIIGIFNIIPYMGPTIGFIIGSLIILVDPSGNPSLLAVLVVIAIVQLCDNVLVYPLAIGKSVNLHPINVIASLLLGGFFFGIIGMLLAVPIVTSLMILTKTFTKAFHEYRI